MTKKTKTNKSKKKVTVKLRKQEKQSRYFLNELFVNNFKAIHGNERPINFGSRITLLFGKNSADYELSFQLILFEDSKGPTITMSKYDYKNKVFLEHYTCDAESGYAE